MIGLRSGPEFYYDDAEKEPSLVHPYLSEPRPSPPPLCCVSPSCVALCWISISTSGLGSTQSKIKLYESVLLVPSTGPGIVGNKNMNLLLEGIGETVKKIQNTGAGETAQQRRAVAAFAEDLGWIPSSCVMTHNSRISDTLRPAWAPGSHRVHTHAGKVFAYIK